MGRSRIPVVVSVGVAMLAGVLLRPAPAQGEIAAGDLTSAVVAKIGAKTGQRADSAGTEVNVMRTDGAGWAFGAGIAKAPAAKDAYPDGWLFVARLDGKEWTVAFEGEAAFP